MTAMKERRQHWQSELREVLPGKISPRQRHLYTRGKVDQPKHSWQHVRCETRNTVSSSDIQSSWHCHSGGAQFTVYTAPGKPSYSNIEKANITAQFFLCVCG